ncbi:MAG TPA: hypothetical protein VNL69_10735, partial [Bacteroidota bacterium]|nr:hypothetical protein [Bacteroidota bacterium]
MKEFTTAFRIVWYIISVGLLLLLAAPFLVPEKTLLSSTPVCRWKALYNRECALCGMSTAFILIT